MSYADIDLCQELGAAVGLTLDLQTDQIFTKNKQTKKTTFLNTKCVFSIVHLWLLILTSTDCVN